MVSDDKRMAEILNDTLADKRPLRSASTILSTARKSRPVSSRLLAGIAAALVAALLISSFWVPGLARAISSVPLFGDAYLEFMKGTGMDIAYQAGFVTELGSQVTVDGITLTVLGAYSDPTQGVVMFTLSSEEPGLMERLWDSEGFYFSPKLKNAGSGSGSMHLDAENNVIHGIIDMKPMVGIFGSKMTLSIETSIGNPPPWKITFPVQKIHKSQLETVHIDESFASKEGMITADELVFTPAQTILRYTITGKNAPGSSVSKPISDSSSSEPEHMSSRWSIQLADGSELTSTGGSHSGNGVVTQGEARFLPTQERELTVLFQGFARFSNITITLPLVEGANFATPTGNLELGKVATHEDNTEVEILWHGATSMRKLDATIIGPAGMNKYAIEGMRLTDTGAILIFNVVLEEATPYKLYLDNVYTEDRTSLIVYELKP